MTGAFLVGATQPQRSTAAEAGLVATTSGMAIYFGYFVLQGFAVRLPVVGLWVVVAVLVGAVFGLAGQSWWSATGRERGLGAALLIAAWLGQAAVMFGLYLRFVEPAIASAAVGAGSGFCWVDAVGST